MTKVDKGWIKIHRKILNWEWYTDVNTKVVFLHLLLKANHEEKNYKGNIIGVGECLTSVASLSRELNLSTKQVRTALNHLKKGNEVASRTANGEASGASIIKLCNYALYQYIDDDEGQAVGQTTGTENGKQRANEWQVKGKQRATPKEYKECNNEKNEKKKEIYGEYQHVLLTDKERDRLFKDYGELETMDAIKYLDEYLESHQKKIKEYTNHNLVLRNWVFNAVKEQKQREERANVRTKNKEEDFFSGLMGFFENNKDEIMGGD